MSGSLGRNRAVVMQLIECECGIKLSVSGVGNYLRLGRVTVTYEEFA